MSQYAMIFGAHLDSLTQEPLCVFPQQLQSLFPCRSSSHPQQGCSTFLFISSGLCSPLADFPLSLHSFHTFINFTIPNHCHHNNLHIIFTQLPCSPLPPCHQLPASADCQCFQVSCGHFSFIILSKSGMVLAQVDWVSVKHQELIEFVLKWLIEGTLLMQS